MKYLEWNNIISSYFFNPANAGKDIHLYLTKNDIIGLGRPYFTEKTENEIWADFITSVKRGVPGSNGNIIAKAKFAHSKNNLVGRNKSDGTPATIEDITVLYPPFISYLVFLVLPLIEVVEGNFRTTNYYGKLNSFISNDSNLGTNDFRNNQINCLWEDLADWANVKNNGDLGVFNIISFTNENWIYVGKVFSQCVLPPNFLNRLPELFEAIGLVPNTFYEDRFLQEKIKNSRTELIPKNTLDFLKKEDELANSIIQTIQRQYRKWTGETHQDIEGGTTLRKKRNYTIAPLFLQFKLNTNDEIINFSYRMYSSNDYPEDLKFDKLENLYEINGWSKTLALEFKEGIELKDNFNKWIAKFPDRDVRLFVSAGTQQLSNDFWIETDVLSKTERMYLLCKKSKQEQIKEWGITFENGNFRSEYYNGLPQNYSLFWFRNPIQGVSDIPILTLYNEKRIYFVGGLKANFRSYSRHFLPEIEIINSDGNEKVYLQYRGADEKLFLYKKTSLNNRWLLPEKTKIDTDFYIKVENENFPGNELAYNLITTDNSAINVNESKLPKRDSFGKKITTSIDQYCLGSNIINPNTQRQEPYKHLFRSTKIDATKGITTATLNSHCGNKLCDFLSFKNVLSTEEFFRAFEFYYSKQFSEKNVITNFNLTKLKRTSLNFYDFIGVLDYDYETKNIVLNPPQFIYIPSEQGRKILLIGARDSALIEEIINTAPKHNLQVELINQFSTNERLLLPDAVIIKAFHQTKDDYGEISLKAFAEELKIKLIDNSLPQVAFLNFSASITEYENLLLPADENDYGWARYVFHPDTLKFEISETANFNKSFSLLEYKLNEYTYQHKLWKENKCYQIDMNWGRFIALKHFNKDVILFDSKHNKVAIPLELPLPRLLAESIMLLSGLAPDFKIIENKKYRIYENIPSIFTTNLFSKLGQTPINKVL